jgi:hypothetical protein
MGAAMAADTEIRNANTVFFMKIKGPSYLIAWILTLEAERKEGKKSLIDK